MRDIGFNNCINFNTHGQNIIDLLLTNNAHLINTVKELNPFGKSDHKSFEFNLNVNFPGVDSPLVGSKYNYKKGNYEALNRYF